MARDFTSNLILARELIASLLTSIHSLGPSHLIFHAGVIDRLNPSGWVSEEVSGLKRFGEAVEHHSAQLEAMAESGVPPKDDPLPTVAGMMTAWKQVLLAQPPLAAIRVNIKGKGKEEAFVDVVARGGEEWIRIYSKKISHLIAEFREQDSYVNSDYDSDDSSARLSKSGLTNSIITTAESLLSVARSAERIPGAPEPKVTIRFSRIEEDPEGGHEDERVSQTFEAVRKMGIELIFGDLGEFELLDLPRPSEERTWRPSRKINLDPTALMGLCSDVLHHPLPLDEEGARARFYRPTEILSSGGAKDGEGPGQSQNSRELVKNLLEEMELPMIEEMRDVLGEDGGEIEFWTTKEAMRYLVEAFGSDEVVGAGMEQRRMRRLAGLEDGDFFEGSRYEGHEGVLKGLKVKVYDDARPSTPLCAEGMSSFQVSISRTCSQFVAEYHADPTSPSLPNFLQARRLPVPKVASFTLPFTVVSLVSLERGAAEGMTTLLMGNIVFRELFAQPRWKVRGWCQGNYEMGGVQAAVWMLPYRSLGEGKRVKFEKGDYSHPPR